MDEVEIETDLIRERRRKWKRPERPWYEHLKKRKIPKTEFNRKDVAESRRQKRVEKQKLHVEIEGFLDEDN